MNLNRQPNCKGDTLNDEHCKLCDRIHIDIGGHPLNTGITEHHSLSFGQEIQKILLGVIILYVFQ